jgi:RimJ/RimL family protein N-acetyltransferase
MRVPLDWAFDERGIHRVEWYASSAGEPSINAARRLGMSRDGVLRQSHLCRGERQDTEMWSVLAPEWRVARARSARDDHEDH